MGSTVYMYMYNPTLSMPVHWWHVRINYSTDDQFSDAPLRITNNSRSYLHA